MIHMAIAELTPSVLGVMAGGDPLKGGTGHGEPMRFLEEIALTYKGSECLSWPFGKTIAGYAQIHIEDTTANVSRMVCERVKGPPPTPGHEAAHSCGKGHEACISPAHVFWKTHIENEADKISHGTSQRGERNPMAKLTDPEVRQILALKGVMTQRAIAQKFHISQAHVSLIHTSKVRVFFG